MTKTAPNAPAEPRKPGRPRGKSDTRERILVHARELFAANGIDNTSVRAVAAAAGVDPALVHHYFGTKQQLFTAAIDIPIDPAIILDGLRQAPLEHLGESLPRLVLGVWDQYEANLVAAMRSLLAGFEVTIMRSFLRDLIIAGLAPRLDDPPGTGILRAEFVSTQMIGVIMARYIIKLEPFTSLSADAIATTIGPNLQRYMTGELPVLGAP